MQYLGKPVTVPQEVLSGMVNLVKTLWEAQYKNTSLGTMPK